MPEAKRLGELINEFTHRENVSGKLQAYQVVGDWEKIVGDVIGRNTDLVRIENGTLYVKTKTGAWRNELIFMKPAILKKIKENYPASGVENIFFI